MGGIIIFKRIYAYITGKSVKQRVYICIALTAMITLLVFTVKANFFDRRTAAEPPQTSVSEYSEGGEGETENTEKELPRFKVSLIDAGVLLAVTGSYSVHKFREKKRQRRL